MHENQLFSKLVLLFAHVRYITALAPTITVNHTQDRREGGGGGG